MPRIPTLQEYQEYDGAHCHHLWRELGEDWRCPGCARSKYQIMRWTKRTPNGRLFWGWMAGLHRHHDHAVDGYLSRHARFDTAVVCDQCNAADGYVKRHMQGVIPPDFSFSPDEIKQFVTATPHQRHRIDIVKAFRLWQAIEV